LNTKNQGQARVRKIISHVSFFSSLLISLRSDLIGIQSPLDEFFLEVKKRKVIIHPAPSLFNPFDSPGLSDLFAVGVNHTPAGLCFHF